MGNHKIPSNLHYMIWASTQNYVDFDHQINILNDHQPLSDMQLSGRCRR